MLFARCCYDGQSQCLAWWILALWTLAIEHKQEDILDTSSILKSSASTHDTSPDSQ